MSTPSLIYFLANSASTMVGVKTSSAFSNRAFASFPAALSFKSTHAHESTTIFEAVLLLELSILRCIGPCYGVESVLSPSPDQGVDGFVHAPSMQAPLKCRQFPYSLLRDLDRGGFDHSAHTV